MNKDTEQLKRVIAEVDAVLKKHDVAGIVIIQNEKAGEYSYTLSPSWSCMTLLPTGELKFKAKSEDYANKEAHKKVVTDSIGMVAGFRDILNIAVENMEKLLLMVGGHFEITHITQPQEEDKPDETKRRF